MAQTTHEASAAGLRPRPAIQLYTLRSIDEPLPETIRRVADAGFEGVEFANKFLDANPHDVRRSLEATGVVPIAAHVDLSELETRLEAIVDRCRKVGCRQVVIPHLGARHFQTRDRVDALAHRLEDLAERLRIHGIELSYHTSREPFLPMLDRFGLGVPANLPSPEIGWRMVAEALDIAVAGPSRTIDRTGFGRLVSQTDTVSFEIDVAWVTAGGYDPIELFDSLGDRLSLIHIADVVRTRRFPPAFRSSPPGEGIVDIGPVLEAARRTDVDWLVFEDDDPTDPVQAIEQGITALSSDRSNSRDGSR